MGSDMEKKQVKPGNKEACKRYYERNSKSAKRRVLLNEISRFGRISKQETLEKWEISIHEIIDSLPDPLPPDTGWRRALGSDGDVRSPIWASHRAIYYVLLQS